MTTQDRSRRVPIRLPIAAYGVSGSAWLVTIGVAGRAPAFAIEALARAVAAVFEEESAGQGIALDVSCLIPDHVHLAAQVTTGNLVDVIRRAKSRSTRHWWGLGGCGSLWQRSFHDRGLRTPREYDLAFASVLENPVRAGLAADWWDSPYLGGLSVRPSNAMGDGAAGAS